MSIKFLSILMLCFSFLGIGFCNTALSEQNKITSETLSAATINMDSNSETLTFEPDLTLEDAVSAALKHNPHLNVSQFNTRLAETDVLQASFFPNPELEFEYENFDEPEKTLSIGYLIELGGKRKHRMEVAGAAAELASVELDAARIEIIYETAAAFIHVLVAQENLRISMEKEKLANQVFETSRERVLAGRVSPLEQVTADIQRKNAMLDVQKSKNDLLIARTNLSSMWGSSEAAFNKAKGVLDRIQSIPSFDALAAAMENSPMIKAKRSEINIAETSLELEKRNRIPDLTLSGGVKQTDESDDTIYIVGLSVPIPLFDHNQAVVSRAAAELGRQAAALDAEKNRLNKDLKIAYQALQTAHRQVHIIKTDILPSAQKVLDGVKEGYQEGEFSFLDMLEAQSTLYESHVSYIHSLEQYHYAVIDLEKLLGKDISEFTLN